MSEKNDQTPDHHDNGHGENHVNVAVITTSGRWPEQGFEKVASHEPVQTGLTRAEHAPKLVGVNDWLATVGDRELDRHQSFEHQGLSGQILINYGPRAGGGGNA